GTQWRGGRGVRPSIPLPEGTPPPLAQQDRTGPGGWPAGRGWRMSFGKERGAAVSQAGVLTATFGLLLIMSSSASQAVAPQDPGAKPGRFEVTDDSDQIRISSPTLEAAVRKRGYVS